MSALWVVATPIGNLGDLSDRARRCLHDAQVVYAEDTRRTRTLMAHIGAPTRLRSLHEHNEQQRIREILEHLEGGADVALVSDAGTPTVSDPGCKAVSAVLAAGQRVSPVPGPSALAAAVSVSGFRVDHNGLLFLGFLPAKGSARRQALERLAAHKGVAILFEAPHRIRATASDLARLQADRKVCLCRELTKIHEEVCRQTAAELASSVAEGMVGEMTLVLDANDTAEKKEGAGDTEAVDQALRRCRGKGMSARDAALAVAAIFAIPRRQAYQRLQELQI